MPTITDQLGRVLQRRYRLDAGLGTGASAHVYLAYDRELAREVAVKLLHPGLADDPSFLRRFRAEAQAAAALNHPNIVQVYDWGEEAGEPFLVLEFLPGGSLRDLLDRGAYLGPAEVARLGAGAARGLEYAHRRGLVHRDIKPANLLFDADGVVHVADFGLARALADAAWTEPAGAVFGTARYASPEQATGHRVDDRSDVYSLALVCYEALVGKAPFRAETPLATLMARVNSPLPPSPALGPLAPILAAAAINEPLARPDAGGFAADLELLQSTLPTPVRLPLELAKRPQPAPAPRRVDPTRWRDDDTALLQQIEPDDEGPDDEVDDRPRRRWRGLIATLVVVLLVVAGVGAYVRFGLYGHTVPRLTGLSLGRAERLAVDAGLRVGGTSQSYSATVPAGEVATQTIRPGTRVRSGSVVKLVVSEGHAPVLLPRIVGLSSSSAFDALHRSHFVMRVDTLYSETVKAGTVISAIPSAGNAAFGSTVAVRVSRGPAPRTIPTLGGLSLADARSALTAQRLVPRSVRAYSSVVPAGDVISSRPAEGATGIAVGSTVTLVVSRGPRLVAVPSVAGDSIASAVAALQAVGLVVTEQVGPPFATSASTTDPAPGSMVSPGSNVTLYVA